MEIRTERLLLEPLGIKYLNTVHEYASDLETTKFMMWLPNDTIEETADFLKKSDAEWAKALPSYYEFAVIFEGRQVGAVSIYLDEKRTTGEFGWILNKAYWNKGIATEAAKALFEFATNELGLKCVQAHCDSENIASSKVMEKLGMKRISCEGGRKNKSSDEERYEFLYELKVE